MKQIMWAIGLAVVLLAGPTLSAEAGGGGRGFHGGGPGMGGGFHGGTRVFIGSGFHGGGHFHGGTRVFIGGGFGWWGWPGWWGPGWWGAPYPYYATSSVVQQAPTEYIQQGYAPPQQTYWYFCQNAGAYYPYVKECPGGWMQVVPPSAPPGP